MKFEAIKKETVMLNPQKEMAEQRISSEIRIDPLTGRTARICHFMNLQWEKPDSMPWSPAPRLGVLFVATRCSS